MCKQANSGAFANRVTRHCCMIKQFSGKMSSLHVPVTTSFRTRNTKATAFDYKQLRPSGCEYTRFVARGYSFFIALILSVTSMKKVQERKIISKKNTFQKIVNLLNITVFPRLSQLNASMNTVQIRSLSEHSSLALVILRPQTSQSCQSQGLTISASVVTSASSRFANKAYLD